MLRGGGRERDRKKRDGKKTNEREEKLERVFVSTCGVPIYSDLSNQYKKCGVG